MMSRSGGLKDKAVAGRPSVTRLTHNRERVWMFLLKNGQKPVKLKKTAHNSSKSI